MEAEIYCIGVDVKELDTREQTLNYICSIRDCTKDLVIVSSDIILTDGWMEQIKLHYDKFDMFGFLMTKPDSDVISNFGFDFVNSDSKLTYTAYRKREQLAEFPPRQCDIINGCFMYIKADVLKSTKFKLDGYNHWVELIFCVDAVRNGFKVGCLGHRIYHGGTSSKNAKELNNSTVSYMIERGLWSKIVDRYLLDITPRLVYNTSISDEVVALFDKPCLVYGCGTTTEALSSKVNSFMLCSALPEEIGNVFSGYEVFDVNICDGFKFKHVINTANTEIKELSKHNIVNLVNRGGRIEIK